ncbi:uncharacterized protein EI90DRAFT_3131408 [Cantharellus anzutake]|uniref:uncharacterized protein n=1 Tax=Cantharellus anzutake TaxID=1750568 RepID=UPI0019081EFD|nr:uncharacterized protein EI90DRAFT_3131408 [Cantharellus anzutake]KAF8321882.1 hypothetical protein EI90DRAFT_3131408 [Cantharellus anzutake]
MSNEKPRYMATMEVAHATEEESEDSSEDKPENSSGDSEASSFEVEDPYEGPQYSPNSEAPFRLVPPFMGPPSL